MNRSGGEQLTEQIRVFGRDMRQRDFCLTRCYFAALCVAAIFLLLPFHLSRLGGVLILLALGHMLCKIYSAYHARPDIDLETTAGAADLKRIRARIAVTRSPFYLLPLLVGANLVFMGLPMGADALREATLDCTFLGSTILLFLVSYWLNQHALRQRLQPILETQARISLTTSPDTSVNRKSRPA